MGGRGGARIGYQKMARRGRDEGSVCFSACQSHLAVDDQGRGVLLVHVQAAELPVEHVVRLSNGGWLVRLDA